jgi:hypothetical protein
MKNRQNAAVLPVVMLFAIFFCHTPAGQAEMMVWDAGLGLLPTELSPAWTWESPSSGEMATITSAVMTIRSIAKLSDVAAFSQTAENLLVPTNLWIEGRTRWVSGTDAHPSRSHVSIHVTTTPNVGNSLWISQDSICILTNLGAVGASAAVDTDEDMHTYRIEVQGTNAGSPFQVYYDGTLKLSGTLFDNASLHGAVPRVFWGDGTSTEGGVSDWEYLAHNASATPGVWLTIRGDPPGVRVAWSTAAYGFVLQTATNLLLTSPWQDDTNSPVVVGHEKSVPVTPSGSTFFRLKIQ